MNKKIDIQSLRQNYLRNELLEENVLRNPIKQFEKWFSEAFEAQILEPNAMHLSTVFNGKPSGRIVLLKSFDEQGFTFYTNYESQKGKAIEANPFAALTFFWAFLERQVRIEGQIEKTSLQESDTYYHSRPRASQIGAWVSAQSSVVSSRNELNNKQIAFEKQFENTAIIPRPPYWGGYRVIPEKIEFWQGRPSRLHDRILFTKEDNHWQLQRLEP